MLVLIKDSGAMQFAGKAHGQSEVCGVCKREIKVGEYYTRHLAPVPLRPGSRSSRRRSIPYNACTECAPFTKLEQHTGEFSLKELQARAAVEMQKTALLRDGGISNLDTQVEIEVVRASTPRLPAVEGPITDRTPRIKRVKLERDDSWLK